MRAGLNTIQQTLTPEAASVLNHSIAEAGRRNHGQTTPLHVAATLLASPSGLLRESCIRSHPNSSHPLQCRALELCFSVALERLPTAAEPAATAEPPISNALMAALKRAQAHQRRGCPEQQQQPLLAVKVELEQLIVSILDDPGVSRVMREASFSSPAVKAAIEQSLNTIHHHHQTHHIGTASITFSSTFGPIGPRLHSNPGQLTTKTPVFLNPHFHQTVQIGNNNNNNSKGGDEVKKVFEIMSRAKRRNPVLVGDSEPDAMAKEILRKIERSELGGDFDLMKVEIISMEKTGILSDKNLIASKMEELGGVIESKIGNGGVVIDLGDLKWLVEQPVAMGSFGGVHKQVAAVAEIGRAVVVEMNKLLVRFGGGESNSNKEDEGDNSNKVWLIGTATCETYLRCQVYHSTIENDWDLQAVPIASRSPMFPRLGTETMLSNPVESISPLRAVPSPSPVHVESISQLKAIVPSPSLAPAESISPLKAVVPSPSLAPAESVSSLKAVPSPSPASVGRVSENLDPSQKPIFCPQCSYNYGKELGKLVAIEKMFTKAKQDAARPLPQWLQNAKLKTTDESQVKDQEQLLSKEKTQELQKKWRQTCLNQHPNFHQNTRPDKPGPPAPSMTSSYNLNLLTRPPFQPKLHTPLATALQLNKPQATSLSPGLLANTLPFLPKLTTPKALGEARQLETNPVTSQQCPPLAPSPPSSPVRTDLVLGTKGSDRSPEKAAEDQAKDFLGCISSEPQNKLLDKFSNALDADSYKKLLKGLMEKAWWQDEAASAVASAITRCRLGKGKRSRGDTWLLFMGPDRVGKKKMALALVENICGSTLVNICLGKQREDEESDMTCRGKTVTDRIAEAIRRNPFSVIMIMDIDEADMIVCGNVKRAIKKGKISDSHGREVSLGNAVFIVTGDWSTTNPEALRDGLFVDEKKLASTASGSWQLGLIVRDKSAKRRASWLLDENRQSRPRKEVGSSLSLDLNLAAAYNIEDDRTDDRSYNSSELTVEIEDELGLVNGDFSISSVPQELLSNVEESIVFKPVNAGFVRREIKKTISVKFSMVVGKNLSIEIGDDVLEKILGGLWHDGTSLEEWVENVVGPSFEELKPCLPAGDRSNSVVRLVVESDSCDRGKRKGDADWLPDSILV